MDATSDRLVWVDLEMTGLDPVTCAIVEIATIVTDSELAVVAEGPSLIVHQPDEVLAKMSDFVRDLHRKSGLLERITASTVTLADAEEQTRAFLEGHCVRGTAPLCGKTVWKDRAFLERYMPSVVGLLHYRMIDVSTLKELVRRWHPERQAPKKQEVHRALDDIRDSIEQLRFYRANLFPGPV